MFAQWLISTAVIAVAAYLLWRAGAAPLIRYLAGPRAPQPEAVALAAGEDELRHKRDELERLERELQLLRESRALDPRIARLRQRIERLKADSSVDGPADGAGRGGGDET